MRKLYFVLLILLTANSCGGQSPGRVEVSQNEQYYDVAGNSEAQLSSQLIEQGIQESGVSFDAVTHWNISWQYSAQCTPWGRCTADGFTVFAVIIFRYPRWLQPPDAPPSLVSEWDSFLSHLAVHENGHRDLAVEAADALCASVESLPAASSEEELDRSVGAVADRILEKLKNDEEAYDTATNHGAIQGAVFP